MGSLEVIKRGEDSYDFVLKKENIEVKCEIYRIKEKWNSFFYIKKNDSPIYEIWQMISLEHDFETSHLPFSKEKQHQIKQACYELIQEIKKHPKYRLKLFPIMNEKIPELWNKIE